LRRWGWACVSRLAALPRRRNILLPIVAYHDSVRWRLTGQEASVVRTASVTLVRNRCKPVKSQTSRVEQAWHSALPMTRTDVELGALGQSMRVPSREVRGARANAHVTDARVCGVVWFLPFGRSARARVSGGRLESGSVAPPPPSVACPHAPKRRAHICHSIANALHTPYRCTLMVMRRA